MTRKYNNFRLDKAKEVVEIIRLVIGRRADFLKIMQLVYMADRDSVLNLGGPITGDVYSCTKKCVIGENLHKAHVDGELVSVQARVPWLTSEAEIDIIMKHAIEWRGSPLDEIEQRVRLFPEWEALKNLTWMDVLDATDMDKETKEYLNNRIESQAEMDVLIWGIRETEGVN